MYNKKIADSAIIMSDVSIGTDVVIDENVFIDSGCTIADGVKISRGAIIGKNTKIESKCVIKERVILGDNVVIGTGGYVDVDVIIRDDVVLGEASMLGCRVILGEYLVDFYETREKKSHPLLIGKNALVRSETIIYGSNEIGDNFQTGHRVTIRECCKIDDNVRIGTLSDIQGHCEIQEFVNIHSNVHIGQKSLIKKYAWLFPYVILTNDPTPPSQFLQGVIIDEFAVVSTGSVILPGVKVGKESLIGAGAVVTKDVDASSIYVGNPARNIGSTDKVKSKETGKNIYPWKYTFDRGMPWHDIGYDEWINSLEKTE